MEIQLQPHNIKLTPQEYLMLFRGFSQEEKEFILDELFTQETDYLADLMHNSSTDIPITEVLLPSGYRTSPELPIEMQQLLPERSDAYEKKKEQVPSWEDALDEIETIISEDANLLHADNRLEHELIQHLEDRMAHHQANPQEAIDAFDALSEIAKGYEYEL